MTCNNNNLKHKLGEGSSNSFCFLKVYTERHYMTSINKKIFKTDYTIDYFIYLAYNIRKTIKVLKKYRLNGLRN